MAGDWIAFDHDFPEKPEVLAIHCRTGVGVGDIMLLMHRLWRTFDRQTEDGHLRDVTVTGCVTLCGADEAFWHSVHKVGWLGIDPHDGHVFMPEFDRRFSKPARVRLLAARRSKRYRGSPRDGARDDDRDGARDGARDDDRDGERNPVSQPNSQSQEVPETQPLQEPEPQEATVASATDCSEPVAGNGSEPAILVFPCVGRGAKTWHLTQSRIESLAADYPGIDVLAECRKARAWCDANSTRRKTAKGLPAFLVRWLSKAQDRTASAGATSDPRGNIAAMNQYLEEVGDG